MRSEQEMLDLIVNTARDDERIRAVIMLVWHIGVNTRFSRNPGKYGKYFKMYLEPQLWDMLQKTYSDASYDHTWEAMFTMRDLFRVIAIHVAEYFSLDYPHGDDERVSAHLKRVRLLPRSLQEIY